MKNICLLFLVIVGLWACENDLFIDPITEKSVSNFFESEIEIEEAINGVYSTLQFRGLYNLYIPAIGEIPSDNTFDEVPANDGGRYGQLDEFTTITSNDIITDIWKDSYIGIQQTNVVLNRIEAIPFQEENIRNARIGELKFIRALLYFNLVRIYGDVPLVIEETTDPTIYFGQGRTPLIEVYSQIQKDLTESIPLLPLEADDPGRVIKTAAEGLLAKVKLTLADYEGAKSLLESVINSGRHELMENPGAVFELENELNKEIIFAVQFASGLNGNTEGSQAFVQFSPSGTVNGAKGHNLPTRDFIAMFDEEDLRKEAYIGLTSQGTPFTKKYKAPTTVPNDGPSDWIVLRYADVLLMMAEVENQLNNLSSAAIYLDQVRNRSGLANTTANTTSEMEKAIELERRFELIGEGHRWFDLLRSEKAISTMNDWFSKNGINISIDDHDLLYPIPQSQINTDPALTQNPGY
ncbi:MAG: RagB/SusD family nutrient uptake outer membrane protein [Bacteroidota bacterium]